MKTTIDLPDALVMQVKLRAVRENKKLKVTFAELLAKGLCSPSIGEEPLEEAVIEIDAVTGFPIIRGGRPAAPGHEITPQRIFEILLEQEVEWYATPR
jgi:hypothetical protein